MYEVYKRTGRHYQIPKTILGFIATLRGGNFLRKILDKTIYNVGGVLYNTTMKRNGKYKGTENKAYIIAMREIRKSNASGTHDNRPNRLRTRKAIKTNAIKEYN